MLNNMVASFTASNQIGEAMKKDNLKKKKGNAGNQIENKEIDKKLDPEQDGMGSE